MDSWYCFWWRLNLMCMINTVNNILPHITCGLLYIVDAMDDTSISHNNVMYRERLANTVCDFDILPYCVVCVNQNTTFGFSVWFWFRKNPIVGVCLVGFNWHYYSIHKYVSRHCGGAVAVQDGDIYGMGTGTNLPTQLCQYSIYFDTSFCTSICSFVFSFSHIIEGTTGTNSSTPTHSFFYCIKKIRLEQVHTSY